MNSDAETYYGRLRFMNSRRDWKGLIINEGSRIFVGDYPQIGAWHVCDLTIEISGDYEIVRWTERPGFQQNPEAAESQGMGRSLPREFRHLLPGRSKSA
jgi:hypothetical protein